MPGKTGLSAKRPRLSLDIDPELRRRLRVAAARRDVSVRQYLLDAIELRLIEDLGEEANSSYINGTDDPVLAALWDNPRDAGYDQL
jgi:hypothetical protein